MNSIIDSINNEKVVDKSVILKNVNDSYNDSSINSNIVCNYSEQISKNDYKGNATEYYPVSDGYQQYLNKNLTLEGNYIQSYGDTDNNIDGTLITQLSGSNIENMSLKYHMNVNNDNGINYFNKLICSNCNLPISRGDGDLSRNETNTCVCNNINLLYYDNMLSNNSQMSGNIIDTSSPQSIITSLSIGSQAFSNASKENLSLRKDDENIIDQNNGLLVTQNCELESSNSLNNINNPMCSYNNRNNGLTVGNIIQNSSLLLSGYLNGTPTQSNSRKILARVRELWLSNIVDGLPRKIAAFILQRHGNQIPYDRQFWSYAYKTGRLHPAEEQVQRQLNEGVQCLNRFIQQLIKSCNIMREHMLRKQSRPITNNGRNINNVYNSKQRIAGILNNEVGEVEISGYINGSLGLSGEEMINLNNNNQRVILQEGDINRGKYESEINDGNVLGNHGENIINRNSSMEIVDNHGNLKLNYDNNGVVDNSIHVSSDGIDNDDALDDDSQVAEIPLDLTDEYLAKWLDGKNALIIRKLVNGDKDVQAIDLPTSLNSDNLYRALRFGGLLVRIPPYNQKSYEYFNLLSPGRGDTRHTQLVIPDGERDIDVKKSRTSLALPDFLVEDIPLPKVCVFQIEAKLELLLLYRGCSSKRPHTKRGRTLSSTQSQQNHHNAQNSTNNISNGSDKSNQNMVNQLSQSQTLINRIVGNSNINEVLLSNANSNSIMINSNETDIGNKDGNIVIMNSGSNNSSNNDNSDSNPREVINVHNDNNIVNDSKVSESNICDNSLTEIEGINNNMGNNIKTKFVSDENYIYLPNNINLDSNMLGINNRNIELKGCISSSNKSGAIINGSKILNNLNANNITQKNMNYSIILDGNKNVFENQKESTPNSSAFNTQSTIFSSNYNNISPNYYDSLYGVKKKCIKNSRSDYSCASGDDVTHPLTSTVCYMPQNDGDSSNSIINSQIEDCGNQIDHLFQSYSQDHDHGLNVNNISYSQVSIGSNGNNNKLNNSINESNSTNNIGISDKSGEYNYNISASNNSKNNDNKQEYNNYLNVYSHNVFEINQGVCNNIENNNIMNCIGNYSKNDLVVSNNQDMYGNNDANRLYIQQNNHGNNVQHPCLNWSLNIN